MAEISLVEARSMLAEVVNRVAYGGERVVLQRRKKSVVAVVSMDDLRRLEELEEESDLRAARKARREKGAVPLARVKARLGMK